MLLLSSLAASDRTKQDVIDTDRLCLMTNDKLVNAVSQLSWEIEESEWFRWFF